MRCARRLALSAKVTPEPLAAEPPPLATPPAHAAPIHAAPIGAVAEQLGVDPARGLDDAEAEQRLLEYGPNELEARRSPGLARLLLDAIREPFILVLLGAGLLAVALGEVRDGLLVLVGLIPIVGADVITEYRAERALEALRASAAPVAHVRRAGMVKGVPAAELVPGDVVMLRTGDVVPADKVLQKAQELAKSLAEGPAFAHAMTKKCLHQEWNQSVDEAIETEAEAQAICMQTGDFERAYKAFVAKQKPQFQGD